jgi:hypothetical protein
MFSGGNTAKASGRQAPKWAPSRQSKLIGLATLLAASGLFLFNAPASALPSYARQTGQPCATCHTNFPELTPYGRRFKLMGYTAGGNYCGDRGPMGREVAALRDYLAGQGSTKDGGAAAASVGTGDPRPESWMPPISVMVIPTFTHLATKAIDPTGASLNGTPDNPQPSNNIFDVQTTSMFYGGQVYCNIGAFMQLTHDPSSTNGNIFLDNTDIRYARTANVHGIDVIYGVSVNNGMTVQDVWNTTPIWGYPYITPGFSSVNGLGGGTFIEGTGGAVIGSTAYVMLNDMLYLEAGAYKSMDPRTLTAFGLDPSGPLNIDGAAPYWRAALELNHDEHSWMFGTFGTVASVYAPGQPDVGDDRFTDIGFDTQYQYIGDVHTFSLKASYIYEWQKRTMSVNTGAADNLHDTVRSFNIAGTYVYDKRLSFSASYFNYSGSLDSTLYGGIDTGGTLTVPKPNTDGYTFDLAYMPFSKGGPGLWPWFNTRIGLQYTIYNKFSGASSNYDVGTFAAPRNASDNNTLFLYWWNAF